MAEQPPGWAYCNGRRSPTRHSRAAFCPSRADQSIACRVRSSAREHLATTVDETHRQLNQTFLFGVTQRRRLARRSDNNNPGHATRDLRFDQMLERFKINFAASKRRYQRRECALKHWFRLHLRVGFPQSQMRGDGGKLAANVRLAGDARRYTSIVPSNTKSAGPVRVTPVNLRSLREKLTSVCSEPDRHQPSTFSVAAKLTPRYHASAVASVSSSTAS